MTLLDFENIYNVEKSGNGDDDQGYCCCDKTDDYCYEYPCVPKHCMEGECETQFIVTVSPCQASPQSCSVYTNEIKDSQTLAVEGVLSFQFTTTEQPKKVQFVRN